MGVLTGRVLPSVDPRLTAKAKTVWVGAKSAPVAADGSFRVVVAHRDPGVPNWLEPAGLGDPASRYRDPDPRVGVAPDLESWILGWGDHAEVIEPVDLRERISETIRSMAAKY